MERCTDTWQDVPGISVTSYAAAARPEVGEVCRPRWLGAKRLGGLLTSLALVAVLMLQPWRSEDTFATGVGEQRVVVL